MPFPEEIACFDQYAFNQIGRSDQRITCRREGLKEAADLCWTCSLRSGQTSYNLSRLFHSFYSILVSYYWMLSRYLGADLLYTAILQYKYCDSILLSRWILCPYGCFFSLALFFLICFLNASSVCTWFRCFILILCMLTFQETGKYSIWMFQIYIECQHFRNILMINISK